MRRARDRERQYQREVPCPVCRAQFWQSKYRAKPETCSRRCAWVIRKQRSSR
jgi:hypothetical protein